MLRRIAPAAQSAAMPDESAIREALKSVRYPGFTRDIVSFGLVKSITVEGAAATVEVALVTKDPAVPQKIEADIREALARLPGLQGLEVKMDVREPSSLPGAAGSGGVAVRTGLNGVKNIIAIASGKGGVGKSTVAANLAVALAARGLATGLCDCDLYGPSMALMFGTSEQLMANDQDQIIPVRCHGVKMVSMGLLLAENAPVVVRGPIATRYIQQFLRQVDWDGLDILVLDLPPGTGDIQLTIVQTVALDGALIVTTPQEVALIDARKAVGMFDKVNVPILGLIENMSWFECPSDGKRYHLFGRDGGVNEARRLSVPLLGQVPITEVTRECGDSGSPVALLPPAGNPASAAFHAIAAQVAERLAPVIAG
jgi:ATP-binding protein involved in chromosome partitioning